MTNLREITSIAPKRIWADVRARIVESDRITLALVELPPDGVVPEHRHGNDQVGMVIEGSVTFRIGEETRELGPGGTWTIPSNEPHQVTAGGQGAVVVDVFSPTRTDWGQIAAEVVHPPRWPR
jgi:quercetin dioxygenase-like cupin family protein